MEQGWQIGICDDNSGDTPSMWEAQQIVRQLQGAGGSRWVIESEEDNGVFLATVNRDFADEARRNKNAQRRVEWDGRSWLIDADWPD